MSGPAIIPKQNEHPTIKSAKADAVNILLRVPERRDGAMPLPARFLSEGTEQRSSRLALFLVFSGLFIHNTSYGSQRHPRCIRCRTWMPRHAADIYSRWSVRSDVMRIQPRMDDPVAIRSSVYRSQQAVFLNVLSEGLRHEVRDLRAPSPQSVRAVGAQPRSLSMDSRKLDEACGIVLVEL